MRGCEAGRAGMRQRSPMQPRAKAVNWARVQGSQRSYLGRPVNLLKGNPIREEKAEMAGMSRSHSTDFFLGRVVQREG